MGRGRAAAQGRPSPRPDRVSFSCFPFGVSESDTWEVSRIPWTPLKLLSHFWDRLEKRKRSLNWRMTLYSLKKNGWGEEVLQIPTRV